MDRITSVVQSSNSIYSTYISTIDHLPCDIIRSLWLVQSCNISAEKGKEKLHQFLHQYNPENLSKLSNEEVQRIASRYSQLKQHIINCNGEALAEIESLYANLVAHNEELNRTIANVEASEEPPAKNLASSQSELRAQLKRHYEEHPLASQVEALQEQKLSKNVVVRQIKGLTKLKIVFKIPKTKGKEQIYNNRVTNYDEKEYLEDEAPLKRKPRSAIFSVVAESELDQMRKKPSRKSARTKESTSFRMLERSTRGAGALRNNPLVVPPLEEFEEFEEFQEPTPEPEPEQYCFCKQASFGDMIACDNRECPNGEWFHYKCVGLLNKVEAQKYTKQKWYCSKACEDKAMELDTKRKMKNAKKRRRAW